MILSLDHTYVRIAALPDHLIEEFLTTRYPGIRRYQNPLVAEDVREIEAVFKLASPGKEDLLTEWFLKSAFNGRANFRELDYLAAATAWYFAHQKEPFFKKIVEEFNERYKREISPKNIMDFSGDDLLNVQDLYQQREEEARINKFPDTLPEGVHLFYNDGAYQILEVEDVGAACDLGLGTRWCTKDEADARKYLGEDPLYVIYKNKEKFAQLHMGRGSDEWSGIQLMNLKNKPMQPDDMLRQVLIKSRLMSGILTTLAESGGNVSQFVRFVGGKEDPTVRAICARDSILVILYAKYVLHGKRFLEGEHLVAVEDPELAIRYAEDLMKGRFIEAEDNIIEQGYTADYLTTLNRVNPEQGEEFRKFLVEQEDQFGETDPI